MVMKEGLGDHVPDWASICGDALSCIAEFTHSVKDRIRMSAVCRSWRAADIKINKKGGPICLMLAETEKSDRCCFYDISEEVFVELDLPEVRERRCLGTPFGWLVTCSLHLGIQLFNPLSRATLPLPSMDTFTHPPKVHPHLLRHGYYFEGFFSNDERGCLGRAIYHESRLVTKFRLSSNPADSDCIVLALYRCDLLAFAKPGSEAWTPVDNIGGVVDLIYFKGNYYACDRNGEIFLCDDLDGSNPKALKFAPPPPFPPYRDNYLFDLDGNLCLAYRRLVQYRTGEDGKTIVDYDDSIFVDMIDEIAMRLRYSSLEFAIFKLDMQTKSWEKIYSLGDRSLFLGNCSTFVVTAADYPGCKPNCIYFTDDNLGYVHDSTKGRGADMGIYDCRNLELGFDDEIVKDDIVEPFPKFKQVPPLEYASLSPPLWIIPYSR